jgi:diguanylate cyclase (GGDEF)-like protein
MRQTIGLYSSSPDLAAIVRGRCPDCMFATSAGEAEACRVVVIDGDSHHLLDAPRKALARVVLYDTAAVEPRRIGDIRVARSVFMANPMEFLDAANDLAETVIHASRLELDVAWLTQIHELMQMTDAQAVSERITGTVLKILDLRLGTLFLHDPRLERYVVSFTNDPDARETGEFLPGIPPDILQRALASGRSFAADRDIGMIVMTLQLEHDLIGVLRVGLSLGDRLEEEAINHVTQYLSTVSSVVGNIYQLTRSRDLAMRDDLTKAFNRRFFEAYLDEEIERARRYGSLFSIIFLDLDDLKTVNDQHGHLAGSRTLQEVAKRILGAVRGIDKVVRFGGDEFCIILPQTDQEQAIAVADRVRKALLGAPFHLADNIDVSISASFGIATYPTHAITKDDLIRQADNAMYRVKSTTKNAVGVAVVQDVRAVGR